MTRDDFNRIRWRYASQYTKAAAFNGVYKSTNTEPVLSYTAHMTRNAIGYLRRGKITRYRDESTGIAYTTEAALMTAVEVKFTDIDGQDNKTE